MAGPCDTCGTCRNLDMSHLIVLAVDHHLARCLVVALEALRDRLRRDGQPR
jgi:hypothetical protein